MKYKIDSSHDKYIKVTISGMIVKSEIIYAMSEMLQHSQYLEKNSFWDLRDASMGLSLGDLREIVGILRLYKPKRKDFADKSALLVPGKMNVAIAEIFIAMTKVLPIKYRVFTAQEQAESYLCS